MKVYTIATVASFLLGFILATAYAQVDIQVYKNRLEELKRDAVFHRKAYYQIDEDGNGTFTWRPQ